MVAVLHSFKYTNGDGGGRGEREREMKGSEMYKAQRRFLSSLHLIVSPILLLFFSYHLLLSSQVCGSSAACHGGARGPEEPITDPDRVQGRARRGEADVESDRRVRMVFLIEQVHVWNAAMKRPTRCVCVCVCVCVILCFVACTVKD